MAKPKTIAHNQTGIVGVQGPYIRQRHRQRKTCVTTTTEIYFQATWQEQGRKRKASFAVSVYGYEGAMNAARQARQRGLKTNG
jgi:hypothetical protein